ncbi:uncharacterized protein LOC111693448 [Trichogramma pretiosum]|uniref:uncharacterized protein LOC111693448 n=1 Tax=Trichogramma pretiosum TaxID=7493 RepID=UPI000C719BDF|nr:uncharacterized protein LOC111693448 [Trichogramma pretiosum]
MRCLKNWQKWRSDLAKTNAKKWFLSACRLHRLIPLHLKNQFKTSIHFYSNICQTKSQSVLDILNRKWLNLLIDDIHIKRGELFRLLNRLRHRIDHLGLPTETLCNFYSSTNSKCDFIYNNALQSVKKKFERLSASKSVNTQSSTDKKNWLINLTKTEIPAEVADILSRGPKFNVPSQWCTRNAVETVKNLESCISANDIRCTVLENFKRTASNKNHFNRFDYETHIKMRQARSFLKNNKHLFFTKADKGNATVCMQVDDYIEKMTTLLNDDETYEKIDRDPFESLQTRTKLLLKEVNEECDRNLSVFQLSLSDTSLARAYGLPKIHKKDVPLRPIISLVGSPTYVLAKIFYEELSPVVKPPASIHNSPEEADKVVGETSTR